MATELLFISHLSHLRHGEGLCEAPGRPRLDHRARFPRTWAAKPFEKATEEEKLDAFACNVSETPGTEEFDNLHYSALRG